MVQHGYIKITLQETSSTFTMDLPAMSPYFLESWMWPTPINGHHCGMFNMWFKHQDFWLQTLEGFRQNGCSFSILYRWHKNPSPQVYLRFFDDTPWQKVQSIPSRLITFWCFPGCIGPTKCHGISCCSGCRDVRCWGLRTVIFQTSPCWGQDAPAPRPVS